MTPLDWKSLLLVFLLTIYATRRCVGESSTCLTVYKEGGAPAVFQSPKCPRWTLPNYQSPPRTTACQSAMLQGRRKSQEDRTLCALDFRIPFPGKIGIKEVVVGIAAVFDGHNGAEASEMASRHLLEYFSLHTYFLLDAVFRKFMGRLPNKGENDFVFQVLNWDDELGRRDLNFERFRFSLPENFDDSFHLEILKQALLRAIHDIDATFSKEASRRNLDSGSTATVVLIADGQILVANIGDSKALLCSEKFESPAEAKASLLRLYRERRRSGTVSPASRYANIKSATSNGLAHFIAEELTRDHHPDRDDERFRVETAGGYVLDTGGVFRVNGQLAVSRAIGDLHYKSYGVISVPEVTDWQALTSNDSYLVIGSDGMFEKLSLQDVCDILWDFHRREADISGLSSSYSLAECLVNTAAKKGSMDNVAAVVVPLGSSGVSQNLPMDRCVGQTDIYCLTVGKTNMMNAQSDAASDLVMFGHPLIAKFNRLLVEGKRGKFGCYYLYENLNSIVDVLRAQKNRQEDDTFDLPRALPDDFNCGYGGSLNLYNDKNLCFYSGMTADGIKDQCINPDVFASFLGLLESIPFHDAGSSYGSAEYANPDLRYVLKRRFGRGSYGEVWLAIYWNCHQENKTSSWSGEDENLSFDAGCFNSNIKNSSNSSAHGCNGGSRDDDLFILKRIMVERGAAVYLSGLREKYFGEVFLNASRCLGGLQSDGFTSSPFEDSNLFEANATFSELANSWSLEHLLLNKFRLQRGAFEEGLDHIARYVESFESQSNEIWLVFHHEGVSLSKLIYTVEEVEHVANGEKFEEVKHVQVLHPSKWWHWLKTTDAGNEEMRNLIWQLLMALKSCHDRNITHRDIKPENMVICFEDPNTGRCLKGSPTEEGKYTTKMRIIDFGSAIDEFTVKHLYGTGPSRAEQTWEYTPPEASLNGSWYQGTTSTTLKYDMWGVGVVMLELILGSPNVFQISALTQALLDPHVEGWNEDLKELAYKGPFTCMDFTRLRLCVGVVLNLPMTCEESSTASSFEYLHCKWNQEVLDSYLLNDVTSFSPHSRYAQQLNIYSFDIDGCCNIYCARLRSFMELCILVPGTSSLRHRSVGKGEFSPASWKCSEEFFSHQIKSRDPLKLGFPNIWALRLVRQLLMWDPDDRLSVDDALRHPYFQPRPKGYT